MEKDLKTELEFIDRCTATVLDGGSLDEEQLYALADIDSDEGKARIKERAAEITAAMCPRKFDTCSIVNARSGLCSENCKWCAQSRHYDTGCREYSIVDHNEAMEAAHYNAECGIHRYSLVASGRAVHGKALDEVCDLLAEVRRTCGGMKTCASLGLLNTDELRRLRATGAERYHCNLETAPSYFSTLCTTHTIADKLATIDAAHELGFDVCSGGIIGMGETRRQRMELAIELRKARPVSIPINILQPIPGTPLADTPLIEEDEIILAVALFRFAHPTVQLRFAGGRARLSHEGMLAALRTGINGAIVGDLLTTIGSTVEQDKKTVKEAGYEW